jgi:hypothetical protein
VVFCSTTFLRLLKLLRSFFIATAKTSYTAGTLNAIRPFSVLAILAVDKNGKIGKYYRAYIYSSLHAILGVGTGNKKGEE